MHEQPNVVLIVLDTARATDALCEAPSVMPTLSSLGETGRTYPNAYASAPWTLPSHASLFTGMYPAKHGAHGESLYLPEEHRTLAETFRRSGYDTIAVSNNTWITEAFGFHRGFETFWKGWQYLQSTADLGAVAHELGTVDKARTAARRLFDGNPLVNTVNLTYTWFLQPRTDDGAARSTERITAWIRSRSSQRPFFMFVNYLEPHIAYRPPRGHAERFLPADATYEEALAVRQSPPAFNVGRYELSDRELALLRGLYRGEMAYVDDALARIRTALREAGEWDDTIVAVIGDHGENIGDHGFLGHQYNIYDTLLHVPVVIHGGAFNDGPARDERLVQLPDLPLTLLDEAGLEAPALREQSQARSFHPDTTDERTYAYAEYYAPQPSVEALADRFVDLPADASAFDRRLRAIRTHEYKLIVGSDGLEELYHVADDPGETTEVATERPRRAQALHAELEAWLESFDHSTVEIEAPVAETTQERLADLGYM